MNGSKKKKEHIVTIVYFAIIGVFVNAYIMDFFMSKINHTDYTFNINIISIYAEIFKNASCMRILLCVMALEILGIYYFIDSNKKSYTSKLVTVVPATPTSDAVQIPARAGQNQYGSARLLEQDKYANTFSSFILDKNRIDYNPEKEYIEKGGLVIGKEDLKDGTERIYYIKEDVHSQTIGATRCGKTRCEVLQSIGCLGLAGESIVASSCKSELYDYTVPFLLDRSYEAYTLDFDRPEFSNRYNFLQPIIDAVDDGDIAGGIDATWDLVSQLVGEPKGERVWNDGESSVIAGCIMAVVYDNRFPKYHRYRNMTNVYYFIIEMCTPVDNILPLNAYKASLKPTHPSYPLLAVGNIAPDKQRGSFYTGAVMTLKLFSNPYIYNMTKQSDFKLADLGNKKIALFLIIPEERNTYYSLVSLFVSQLYAALSKDGKQKGGRISRRVNCLWDEFGQFKKIPIFINMLTAGGGKGIRQNIFIQGSSQLEEVYEKTGFETISGNCENWVYLHSEDEVINEKLSKKLGDYTTTSYSLSSSSSSTSSSSSSGSSGHNISLQGRRLLYANEIAAIRRPYSLVTSMHLPAIMYAPDLSKWQFNEIFGLGDEEHNRKLSIEREAKYRKKYDVSEEMELWGIWDKFKQSIKNMINKEVEDNESNKTTEE